MKIGLALGGGGAKGAYQIGVLKALDEYKVIDLISAFSGVSIGALNAYFYLSGKEKNSLYNAWLYGIENNPLEEKGHPYDKETKGFFSMDIVKEMAELHTDINKFKESDKDLYVVLTKVEKPSLTSIIRRSQWEKVIVHLNEEKNSLEYVLSSASVPVVFGFHEVDDNFYLDGGLVDNNPVEILIEEGCNIIFYSALNKRQTIHNFEEEDVTFIELTSAYAMPRSFISHYLSIIDFEKSTFKQRMDYGYFVTKNMIEYLLSLGVLVYQEDKLVFNKRTKGFKHIVIPDEIHEQLKIIDKEEND